MKNLDSTRKDFLQHDLLNLSKSIQDSFDKAVVWSLNKEIKNQVKSAKFVHELGKALNNLLSEILIDIELQLNVIEVDDEGEKSSGEWLLDITITKNKSNKKDGFKEKIILAAESESDCSEKAFNDDFAKLFHINADYYLYLNGLNHKTSKGKENYINTRLDRVKTIIKESKQDSDKKIWFAFWASPCNSEGTSIWNQLDGSFQHLKNIWLFEFDKYGEYKEITVN